MPQHQFYRHGSHIAVYKEISDLQAYWSDHWRSIDLTSLFQNNPNGRLGEFEYPFIKYLPKDGTILEAGCGTGRYVHALTQRGYNIEGIDYSEETISRIQAIAPHLSVRVGNINSIDRPDEFYTGYISIGVLEHLFTGHSIALIEAFRILRRGGVAIISTPYLNHARRKMWNKIPEAPGEILQNGQRFYQDHINVETFNEELELAGFKVIDHYEYGFIRGFERDYKLGQWLANHNYLHWRIGRYIRKASQKTPAWLKHDHCHMMMWICNKP